MGNQREGTPYEDLLRQLLGMQAYGLFTFDKAVSNTIKLMNTLKNDAFAIQSWKLFKKYENSPTQYREELYYKDFLRLIAPGAEPGVLIRLCK